MLWGGPSTRPAFPARSGPSASPAMGPRASWSRPKPVMCIEIGARNRVSGLPRAQAGLSLIELIMFIVIVGVGIAGILSVLNLTAQKSADPMIRKQMLAGAESLLEEGELMPFTYIHPYGPTVPTPASPSGCAPLEGDDSTPP